MTKPTKDGVFGSNINYPLLEDELERLPATPWLTLCGEARDQGSVSPDWKAEIQRRDAE